MYWVRPSATVWMTTVESDVASVGVVESVGVQQRSVQRRVEGLHVVAIPAGHRDTRQRGVPFPRCGSANRVEGRCALGRQVGARSVDTDVGDRGAHLDRGAGRELHVSPAVRRRRAADAGIDRVAVPGAVGGERLAELHREIHRVGVVLVAEAAAGRPPGDGRVVLADLDGRAGVTRQRCAGAHVEQRRSTVARVLEPADAGAGGGGEFRGHSGGREPHGVVTGYALFRVVVRDPLPGVPGLRSDRGGGRQHGDVAERRAARRRVGHAEPGGARAVVAVSGVGIGGIRRILHHPERHGGAGEVVDLPHRLTARSGADEGVDVLDGIRDEGGLAVVRARRYRGDECDDDGQGGQHGCHGDEGPAQSHSCLLLHCRRSRGCLVGWVAATRGSNVAHRVG